MTASCPASRVPITRPFFPSFLPSSAYLLGPSELDYAGDCGSFSCPSYTCHRCTSLPPQGPFPLPLSRFRSTTSLFYSITMVMFKQRHSTMSPAFVPDTPKLPKLSLPEEPCTGSSSRPATRADTRRPQTPVRVIASSRSNPTAGQPAVPLKSILKATKNAQPRDSYESEGEILSKKIARSQYNIPPVLPPGSRLGMYAFDPLPCHFCSPAYHAHLI